MACSSYGLSRGSMSYDSCVGREIDARRYRQEATVTTYSTAPAPVAARTAATPTTRPLLVDIYRPSADGKVLPR